MGLFAPPEELSAAVTIETLYFYALARECPQQQAGRMLGASEIRCHMGCQQSTDGLWFCRRPERLRCVLVPWVRWGAAVWKARGAAMEARGELCCVCMLRCLPVGSAL